MDINQLIEIGLAGTDRDRVDIVDLEPVKVATEAVVGLSAIISQLVYNATELLSPKEDRVEINGAVVPDGYSLLVVDHGEGMSDEFLEGLNHILANPSDPDDGSSVSGVQLVARLADRHGIAVGLEHSDPGVTARVSIPTRLLDDGKPFIADPFVVSLEELEIEAEPEPLPEPLPEPVPDTEPVARSKVLTIDTEEFLERIFGPLRNAAPSPVAQPEIVDIRPVPAVTTPLHREIPENRDAGETPEALTGYRRTTLSTRIPGRNYNESDPAPSHTKPGEAAVEIKLALADFTRGRQAASAPDDEAN